METSEGRGLHVVELRAENVKRLRAVHVKVEGEKLVVVSGPNMAGKTSVLDSIMYALAGGRVIPERPVREGERSAFVEVDLGQIVVRRSWTSDEKSELVIEAKDGARYSSPQRLLDELCGDLTFDPLAFCGMKAADQAQALARAVGIDLPAYQAKLRGLTERRRDIGRDGKQAEALLKAAALPAAPPTEPVSVEALMEELRARQGVAQRRDALAATIRNLQLIRDEEEALIKRIEKDIAALQEQISKARMRCADSIDEEQDARRALDALPEPNIAEIEQAIGDAGRQNQLYQQAAERARLQVRVDELREAYRAETAKIEALGADLARQISEAALPVQGLGLSEAGVTLHGLPFEQASGAQRLETSVAVAMAANPRIRVMLIRDGSLLDDHHLALLDSIAQKNDLQIWLEVVARGDEKMGIVIEDGQVTAHNPC